MSSRTIDPTRQGIATHEPEPDTLGNAAPVTLEEALAIVDGWKDGYAPFRLHQVCRTLREAYGRHRTAYRITIHQDGSTIVLPCGLIVESRPHDTESYLQTARDLGYGEDVLSMAQHHDALHLWLCEMLGIESFSLRQAAGQDVEASLAADEESAVLAVQKFAVRAGVDIRGLVKCED